MKFIWEESDIVGGLEVISSNNETYLLGYYYPEKEQTWTLILKGDGFIYNVGSKKQIADYLTREGFSPKPREINK